MLPIDGNSPIFSSEELLEKRIEVVRKSIEFLDNNGRKVNAKSVASAANLIDSNIYLTFHLVNYYAELKAQIKNHNPTFRTLMNEFVI
jgi:hypothetical protein